MKGLFYPENVEQRLVLVIFDAFSFSTLGTFICIVTFIISFFFSDASSAKAKKAAQNTNPEGTAPLFPSMIQSSCVLDAYLSLEPENVDSSPQPCSTGLTTRLLPFKNKNGEIEWVFTDDIQAESNLDVFKISPDISKAVKRGAVNNEAARSEAARNEAARNEIVKAEERSEVLSPITSSSSNNDSLNENKSPSVQISTPSSTFSEDRGKEEENGEGDGPHMCPHCDAKFRLRGYLTRHLKKHSSEKAYKCPFHESSIYKDEKDHVHKCHPNGAFSRRDTYKTHLKTRHFKYPEGTSIKGRPNSEGNCSMCGEWFENAEMWSEIHIEGHECRYLPKGFKGKSRLKNRMRKQMNRMIKMQKKQNKIGACSEFHPASSESPYLSTPNSLNTPALSASLHEIDESPTHPISPSTVSNIPAPVGDEMQRPALTFGSCGPPGSMFDPSAHNLSRGYKMEEDYGDEYCLDTEQMGLSGTFQNNHGVANGHNMLPFYGYSNAAQPFMSQYIH